MSLEKHINRELNLKLSEPLYIGNGQTGVYANHKWVDEKSSRVIIYYHDAPYDSRIEPRDNFIDVMGKTFEIEYWREERPAIASEQKQKEMFEKAKLTAKGKNKNYSS